MAKLIFRLAQAAALLTTQLLSAQNFTGTATYEVKAKPPPIKAREGRQLSPEMQKDIEEQTRRQLEKTFTLNFNTSESSWEEQKKLEAPNPSAGGASVRIMDSGNSTRYNNLKSMTTLIEEEIFGKEFLVADELQRWDWKLTDESKKIGNYTCYKAIVTIKVTDEQRKAYEERKKGMSKNPSQLIIVDEPQDYEITAWYTPEIPVALGPEGFWGLPGLILETNDGNRTILCSKLVLNPKEKPTIYIPRIGEKVTRQKFEEINQKKMKEFSEMRQSRGKGNGRVIRVGG